MESTQILGDNETVARYIRDPQSFPSSRRKHKAKGEPIDWSTVNPFYLFRPRPGETETSVVRESYGRTEVINHSQDIPDTIGLAELKVSSIKTIQSAQGRQVFVAREDPLPDFPSHATLSTPSIPSNLFPGPGENMNNSLKIQLKQLYESLYAVSQPLPPMTIQEWADTH